MMVLAKALVKEEAKALGKALEREPSKAPEKITRVLVKALGTPKEEEKALSKGSATTVEQKATPSLSAGSQEEARRRRAKVLKVLKAAARKAKVRASRALVTNVVEPVIKLPIAERTCMV